MNDIEKLDSVEELSRESNFSIFPEIRDTLIKRMFVSFWHTFYSLPKYKINKTRQILHASRRKRDHQDFT